MTRTEEEAMTSPQAPGSQTPRTTRTVLVVVLFVLLGICGGGIAGVVGGHTAARLAEPAPLGPTALPAIPEKVPASADMYLDGLTVSLLTEDFLRRARWTCETEPLKRDPVAAYYTSCTPPERGKLMVSLWHDDETKVKAVKASCYYPLGSTLCRTLAGSLADLTIVGQPDVAKRTAAWAADNVDRDATTVIGDVRLIADISLEYPTMRIIPAE